MLYNNALPRWAAPSMIGVDKMKALFAIFKKYGRQTDRNGYSIKSVEMVYSQHDGYSFNY